MIKLVDGQSKFFKKDEIMTRSSSDNGLLLSSFYLKNIASSEDNIEFEPVLELFYYKDPRNNMQKTTKRSTNMLFTSKQDIAAIISLFAGALNNGIGAIKASNGAVLELNKGYNESGEIDAIIISGFHSVKKYRKHKKSYTLKHCAWNISLKLDEAEKLLDNICKAFVKIFNISMPEKV